jgi:uncharacterized protein YjbJ (UPF0337 family)
VIDDDRKRRQTMGIPNKEEIKGKAERAKGAIKENLGRAAGNRETEREGAAERDKGRAREQIGKARRKVGDAIKDVGEAIRK